MRGVVLAAPAMTGVQMLSIPDSLCLMCDSKPLCPQLSQLCCDPSEQLPRSRPGVPLFSGNRATGFPSPSRARPSPSPSCRTPPTSRGADWSGRRSTTRGTRATQRSTSPLGKCESYQQILALFAHFDHVLVVRLLRRAPPTFAGVAAGWWSPLTRCGCC